MSHDIRTPMNVITNMAKMVLEEPENKTQVLDYMNKICSMSTFLMGLSVIFWMCPKWKAENCN